MKFLILGTILFASFMSGVHAEEIIINPATQKVNLDKFFLDENGFKLRCGYGLLHIRVDGEKVSGCYSLDQAELNRMVSNAKARGQLLVINSNAKGELMYSVEDNSGESLKSCQADLQTISLALTAVATNNSESDAGLISEISNGFLVRTPSSGTQE